MKYSELIRFKPIESTIQLLETADKKVAQDMVQTYVMSDKMAENIKATVIDQLQMEEVVDNKISQFYHCGSFFLTDNGKEANKAAWVGQYGRVYEEGLFPYQPQKGTQALFDQTAGSPGSGLAPSLIVWLLYFNSIAL